MLRKGSLHPPVPVPEPWAAGSFPAVFGDCELYNELANGTNPALDDLQTDESLMKFVLGAIEPAKIPFEDGLDFGARLVYLTSTRGCSGGHNAGVGTVADVGPLRKRWRGGDGETWDANACVTLKVLER
jgi:hypothetical protein